MGIVVFGVWSGEITDDHAHVRRERIFPLLFGLLRLVVVSLGASFGSLDVSGAVS